MAKIKMIEMTEEETKRMSQAASIIDTMLVEVRQDLRMNSGSMSEEQVQALKTQQKTLIEESRKVTDKQVVQKAFDVYSPFLLQRRAEEKQRKE